MEYINKQKLIPARNSVRYKDGAKITDDLIRRSLKKKISEYGIRAQVDSCEISNGLFGDVKYGIAVFHPSHQSDYYKFCITSNMVGTTRVVDIYMYGRSSNINHENYAANTKIFTGSGARGTAAGAFTGGALGAGVAIGSVLGSAVGAGFRAVGKGINALMRDSEGLELEQQWYAVIADIFTEVFDYSDFDYIQREAIAEQANDSNNSINTNIDSNTISIEELEYASQQGNNYAKGLLGVHYMLGKGVPEDKNKAFLLFKEAADEGDMLAQKNLGLCYMFGDGVMRSDYQAANWFDKAAQQGDVCSKVNLAHLLSNADGIAHDYTRAETLYNEVVDLGPGEDYDNAVCGLALLYSVVLKHHNKAFPLLEKSAEQGYIDAQYQLGLAYRYGKGTEANKEEALRWFKEAVSQGHEEAEKNLKELENEEFYKENEHISEEMSKTKEGCYVATAVYGSYNCPEVWTLRRFRDYKLAKSFSGRVFIKVYYAVSPILVKCFGNTDWFKKLWRGTLDKFVKSLQERGYENTPYYDKFI